MDQLHEYIKPCPACHVYLTRNTEGRPFTSLCPTVIEQPTEGSRKWRLHCYSCGARTRWTSRPEAIELWNAGETIPGPVKRKSRGMSHADRQETV